MNCRICLRPSDPSPYHVRCLRRSLGAGHSILKPQAQTFPEIRQNELLTMRMAEHVGIDIPSCGLVRLRDDTLAYIVRRFDRAHDERKLRQEDFCQLAEQPPKDKSRDGEPSGQRYSAAWSSGASSYSSHSCLTARPLPVVWGTRTMLSGSSNGNGGGQHGAAVRWVLGFVGTGCPGSRLRCNEPPGVDCFARLWRYVNYSWCDGTRCRRLARRPISDSASALEDIRSGHVMFGPWCARLEQPAPLPPWSRSEEPHVQGHHTQDEHRAPEREGHPPRNRLHVGRHLR